MSTSFRYAWTGILLVCAIAGALIVREVRRAERAAAAVNLATQRKEQVRQRVTLAEQKLARAEREKGANPAGASPATEATAVSAATVTTTGTKDGAVTGKSATKLSVRGGKIRPEVAEATDPVLRDLHIQAFEAQLDGIWGPLLLQLNLPKEKEAALKALLRAHEERRMDVTAVAGEQQLELNDPAIQKMRNADGALLARQALELLGPDDGNIYQQFRREMAVQAQITGLAAATYQTSTPLTYAESLQLRSILAAHSERMANGFVRPGAIDWEAALAQVERSGTFSATTVEGFRRQVADQQMHRQIGQRWDEIRTNIMGPGRSEIWVPNFPALQPKPWTGSATIPKAH
jgi:hypothetical protein